MFSLTNKTTIITGGGSGIGKAIAELFGKQGANVFILDVDETGAQDTVDTIKSAGGTAAFFKCNIGSPKETADIIENIAAKTSSIEIIINNAGIAHVGTVESTTDADFDRLISVNVKGVFHIVRSALPYMKEKGGSILNMASIASTVGIPDRFAYSMTKGAVVGMTLSIAKDYLKYNIRCNCISPARVHTPFVDGFLAKNYPGREEEMFKKLSATQPIGRMGRPDEIAFLALYLCSDEASFITGCDYPIDGGFSRLNN
ncbi:MAG: SDR family oxidoreductase [Chitinophagaceae bacterium]|nr:SDR family oxidoreductase [Chitinophagaceae bacterium]